MGLLDVRHATGDSKTFPNYSMLCFTGGEGVWRVIVGALPREEGEATQLDKSVLYFHLDVKAIT